MFEKLEELAKNNKKISDFHIPWARENEAGLLDQ